MFSELLLKNHLYIFKIYYGWPGILLLLMNCISFFKLYSSKVLCCYQTLNLAIYTYILHYCKSQKLDLFIFIMLHKNEIIAVTYAEAKGTWFPSQKTKIKIDSKRLGEFFYKNLFITRKWEIILFYWCVPIVHNALISKPL